jgi:hypothetical protein
MKKIILKAHDIMPGINLDADAGKLEFYGKSCPVDAHEFYEPILKWIDEYISNPQKLTIVQFYLSYFNTVSAKNILKIMNKLEKLNKRGKNVVIQWKYNENDEILREAGEDFETIVEVDFEFIEVPENDDEGIPDSH